MRSRDRSLGWVMWLYLVTRRGDRRRLPGASRVSALRRRFEATNSECSRLLASRSGSMATRAFRRSARRCCCIEQPGRSRSPSISENRRTNSFIAPCAADPWNTLSYVRFAQFLDEFPPEVNGAPGESEEELLLSALGFDPLFVPALDQLLALLRIDVAGIARHMRCCADVYPWMPTLRRNDPEACARYFDLLEALRGRDRRHDLSRRVARTTTRRAESERRASRNSPGSSNACAGVSRNPTNRPLLVSKPRYAYTYLRAEARRSDSRSTVTAVFRQPHAAAPSSRGPDR